MSGNNQQLHHSSLEILLVLLCFDLPCSGSFIGQFFWETWCVREAKEALKYPQVPQLFCSKHSGLLPQYYPLAIIHHGFVKTTHTPFAASKCRLISTETGIGEGRQGRLSHPAWTPIEIWFSSDWDRLMNTTLQFTTFFFPSFR